MGGGNEWLCLPASFAKQGGVSDCLMLMESNYADYV